MTTTRGQHLLGKEIGSCLLENLLGYGGSSVVFLARLLTTGEQVAVKVFLPRSTLDRQMRKNFYQRFLREAEAAGQLNHPHILTAYAYGEHEGMPYIVMPYMVGGTLAERVQRYGTLSLSEALVYLEQIADALDYAHRHHCVHCDVKPANILLDAEGQAALSDFGIVHMVQGGTGESEKQNGGETLMGTPDYVSPEQALGEPLDGRSDIYSLGATLYALLAGRPPFRADTPIALALMHVHDTPVPLSQSRADVTPQLDAVMTRALAKWPNERFQTAGEFAAAFREALTGSAERQRVTDRVRSMGKQQTPPRRPALPLTSTPAPTPTGRSGHPWQTGLLIGLVTMLVVACLLTVFLIRNINTGRASETGKQVTVTPTIRSGPFDALADDEGNWPRSNTFFFQGGSYAIQNTSPLGDPAVAFYQGHTYANVRVQVTTMEVNGSFDGADYYGLAFRGSPDQARYYLFDVTGYNHGQYVLLRYDGGTHWTSLASGALANFDARKGVTNILAVEAKGNTFSLFVNGKAVGRPVNDSSRKALTAGGIGLLVEKYNTEVVFSHLTITTL